MHTINKELPSRENTTGGKYQELKIIEIEKKKNKYTKYKYKNII